jgi:hypothetical protein
MGPSDQAEIDLAANQFVRLLTRHLPGFLQSFSLVGSAVDGDFRAGRSDLDFVAVVSRPITAEDIDALVIVHRLYAADLTFPVLDGIWITEADLRAGPDTCTPGPATRDGVLLEQAVGNRNPITWFALRSGSRTMVGELDRDALWHDPARLRSWTCENVEAYWAGWRARAGRMLSVWGLRMLGPSAVMWGVLGISRLHFTLSAGAVGSKSAAGEHALKVFEPRWHRIINESLRIRRGEGKSLYHNPFARRRDALDFVGMAITAIRGHCASE